MKSAVVVFSSLNAVGLICKDRCGLSMSCFIPAIAGSKRDCSEGWVCYGSVCMCVCVSSCESISGSLGRKCLIRACLLQLSLHLVSAEPPLRWNVTEKLRHLIAFGPDCIRTEQYRERESGRRRIQQKLLKRATKTWHLSSHISTFISNFWNITPQTYTSTFPSMVLADINWLNMCLELFLY